MSVPFKLGDRVIASKKVVKDYVMSGLILLEADIAPVEGIVVGHRWIAEGRIEYSSESSDFFGSTGEVRTWVQTPRSGKRYWIVYFDIRRNPIHVPDSGMKLIEED